MHAALQIITRGAQIAQLLGADHAIIFGRGLDLFFLGGDVRLVKGFQLFLASRDVKRQLVIKIEGLFIELVERFDVFQQPVFMLQQAVGDIVDLALHGFIARHELGHGLGAAKQAFPPAQLAVRVQFIDRKAAQTCDHFAQRCPRLAHILVAHTCQHFLRYDLQFALRGRTKGDDGLRVAHVQFGNAFGNGGLFIIRCLIDDDQFALGFGQKHLGHFFDLGQCGFGLGADIFGHGNPPVLFGVNALSLQSFA